MSTPRRVCKLLSLSHNIILRLAEHTCNLCFFLIKSHFLLTAYVSLILKPKWQWHHNCASYIPPLPHFTLSLLKCKPSVVHAQVKAKMRCVEDETIYMCSSFCWLGHLVPQKWQWSEPVTYPWCLRASRRPGQAGCHPCHHLALPSGGPSLKLEFKVRTGRHWLTDGPRHSLHPAWNSVSSTWTRQLLLSFMQAPLAHSAHVNLHEDPNGKWPGQNACDMHEQDVSQALAVVAPIRECPLWAGCAASEPSVLHNCNRIPLVERQS